MLMVSGNASPSLSTLRMIGELTKAPRRCLASQSRHLRAAAMSEKDTLHTPCLLARGGKGKRTPVPGQRTRVQHHTEFNLERSRPTTIAQRYNIPERQVNSEA